jgi:hypothetical protein
MEDKILDAITVWAPIALIVLSAINACTQHYTRFNGIIRLVMAIVERLSFLASKNTGKLLKAPLANVGPNPAMERMQDVEKQLKAMAKRKKVGGGPLAGRR